MPTGLHEMLLALLRREPEAALRLLQELLGDALPAGGELRPTEANLTPASPPELRADLLFELHREGRPVFALLVEAQLRTDRRKAWAWPQYVAAAHARLRCPVALLVLTPHAAVARWARRPLVLGPGAAVTPLVLGPDNHPRVTLPEVEAWPVGVTLLSGLIHKHGPEADQVLRATAVALGGLDLEHATVYHDLLTADLTAEQRRPLEAQMDLSKYTWRSEFARTHRQEGRQEGRAEGLLTLLRVRGLVPTEAEGRRIAAETDPARFERWTLRALTCTSVAEVLAPDA